jgi:hypothetical protein
LIAGCGFVSAAGGRPSLYSAATYRQHAGGYDEHFLEKNGSVGFVHERGEQGIVPGAHDVAELTTSGAFVTVMQQQKPRLLKRPRHSLDPLRTPLSTARSQ